MKKALFFFIFLCLTPWLFGDPAIGIATTPGDGNGKPLSYTDNGTTEFSETETGDFLPTENTKPTLCRSLVFIVSTDPSGEYNAMNTVAILCHAQPTDEGYVWQGVAGSWADFDHLHYRLTASGENGVETVSVKQYIFGEETDTPVYVREILCV